MGLSLSVGLLQMRQLPRRCEPHFTFTLQILKTGSLRENLVVLFAGVREHSSIGVGAVGVSVSVIFSNLIFVLVNSNWLRIAKRVVD